jgi:UDP-N-acetylmuramoyl-tripeptide--D-alanyl-D-alanine ligase
MITLEKIAEICSGRIHGTSRGSISSVVLDSRKVEKGDLFICLKGERTDGHLYLDQAFQRGALAALVERVPAHPSENWTLIQVESTFRALFDLASYWRSQFHPIVIGITGTVGKTTTKEMTAALLSKAFNLLKSEGNLNTELGVPLTLLKLRESHQLLVLEMGLQKPGDIRVLSQLTRPHIGIITEVGPAHLEYLGSVKNVAREKLCLVESLPKGGIVILNKDNPFLSQAKLPEKVKAYYFSLEQKADFSGRILEEKDEHTLLEVSTESSSLVLALPFRGRAFLYDFLAAFAVAFLLGVPLSDIKKTSEVLSLVKGRGTVKRLPNKFYVVDDTYNSNPTSLLASLNNFVSLAQGRKIAVLGDMLELGKEARLWHRKVGESLPRDLDLVLLLGELSQEIKRGAERSGFDSGRFYFFSSQEELLAFLQQNLREGDWVLVKGSRGMQMERIVEAVENMK